MPSHSRSDDMLLELQHYWQAMSEAKKRLRSGSVPLDALIYSFGTLKQIRDTTDWPRMRHLCTLTVGLDQNMDAVCMSPVSVSR